MAEPRVPPHWLPIPGIPYEVTTSGETRVRRLIAYQMIGGSKRRVGGNELTPLGHRAAVSISIPTPHGSIRRQRSLRALRAEALEAWVNGLDPKEFLPGS